MNLKKLSSKLGLALVMLVFLASTAFAQAYVSATDGDDNVGDGTMGNPYLTITNGITKAGDGGTVIIEPGDYNETVTVPNDMTITASDFGGTGFSTVTINGLVISTTNAGDVVSFAESGLNFFIENANDLTLTKGVLNIGAANVTLQTGLTITRTAGSINATPTFTDINVTYNGTGDIVAGPELPADIGTGVLTVAITAGKSLTATNALTTGGGLVLTSGNFTLSGDLTLEGAANVVMGGANADDVTLGNVTVESGATLANPVINNGGTAASTLTLTGNLSFEHDGVLAGDATTTIQNGAGDMTLNNGFDVVGATVGGTARTVDVAVTNGAGDLTASDEIEATVITNGAGKIVVTGGSGTNLVNNTAAGVFELAADFELSGAAISIGNGTAVVKLNANTLSLSNNAAVVTLTGDIISTTASTVGSGTVAITGNKTTVNGAGEMPNISIASGKELEITNGFTAYGNVTNAGNLDVDGATTVSGNLTSTGLVDLIGAGITVEGDYAQNTDGTLNFGANTFAIEGDWFRDSNVLNDVTFGTGTLTFQGSGAAVWTPGAQLTIANVIINKALAAETVTLTQSVKIDANFTITTGQLRLDNHLRMLSGVFTNGSSGYLSNNDNAFLIIDGASNLAGAATYSNLDMRANTTLNNAITINGIVHHRTGTLALGGFNATWDDDYSRDNEYNFYTDAAVIVAGGGTFAVAAGVTYDLTYLETTATTAGVERLAAGIRNLTINTEGTTIRLGGATTITGALSVTGENNGTAALDLQDGNLTLAGDGITHSILGTVSDVAASNDLIVTGDGATIDGGTATTSDRTIEDLTVNLAAASETFTLKNIINITLLTNTLGTSTVSLVDDGKATVLDDATLGDLELTAGTVTLTLGGATPDDITNASVLQAGTLNLGSDLVFAAALSQGATADAAINLNSYDLTVKGDFTHNNAGQITGTGVLTMDATGASTDMILTSDLSVSNLEIKAGGNDVDLTVGDVDVTDSFTLTSGAFDLNAQTLELSGDTFTVTAGTIPTTGGAGLVNLTGDAVTYTSKVDLDLANLTMNVTSLTVVDGNSPSAGNDLGITTNFVQTAGDVNLDDNNLIIDAGWTRTAGDYTMTTGMFVIDNAVAGIPDVDQGTGWAVDNLKIDQNKVTMTTDQPFTVNKSLVLDATLDANTGAGDPENLILADGVTVERQSNTAKLEEDPNYLGQVNLSYTTAGAISTSNEVPTSSTVLDDVNIEVAVVLERDLTVNGTLTVDNTTVDITTSNGKDLNMAAGATVHVIEYAGAMFDEALKPAGTLNVYFEQTGAVNSDDNILDKDFDIGTLTIDGAAVGDEVNLHDNITVETLVVNDDAPLDLTTKNLTVTNATLNGVGGTGFVTASTAGDLIFGGSAAGTLNLGADWTVPANVDVVLNKTANDDVVTLTGGKELDFANNDLVLTKGVFDTDASSKIILEQGNAAGQPTQGFTRTSGVIIGNVEKFVDRTSPAMDVDRSMIIYPTGSADGEYRPAVFYFKTQPQSSINLMVNHEEASPNGENGLPLVVGDQTITNYPDMFWYVKSDVALAPSYKFDVEFQAEGYSDYLLDGIENVRLIRRDSGNVANNWVLQGSDENYDNSTIAANHPLVKVIDATGGITTQGSRFTYSQSDKAPVFDAALTPQTIDEGDTLTFTYVATDPDIGQTATMSAVTVPDGATFTASTGVFTWITDFEDAGDHIVTIRATDDGSAANTRDTTVTITVNNVNRVPVWTTIPSDTLEVGEGDTYTLQLVATDADNDTLTYSNLVNAPAPDSVSVDSTGLLTIIPDFGEVGNVYDITVRVDDGNGGVVDSTFQVEVVKTNRAPVFTSTVADTTVDEGQALALTFTGSDPDADNLTFSLDASAPAGAAIDTAGAFTWTPGYTQAGTHSVIVVLTDDGSPAKSAMDTVVVTVEDANAAPTFTKVFVRDTVFVGDTFEFTYEAEDLDGDALTFTFADEYPDGSTLTAVSDTSATFAWTPTVNATAIYLIKVKVSDGTGEDNTTGELLVKVVTVDVAGVVTYSDGALPIAGAVVTLAGGASDMVDTTDAAGAYTFTGVSAGSYTVSAAKTGNSGGVSAADALAAAKYGNDTTSVTLTDIELVAADVNMGGTVNASDALVILRHAVGFTGEDNPAFLADEWYFESNPITVATANVTSNLAGIVSGDVNSSFTPGLAKETVALAVNNENLIKIKPNAEFEVPVRVASAVKVGAYTLELSYDASLMEFVSVAGEGVIANTSEEGVIKLGYADLSGKKALELEENGVMTTLTFKATEAFAKSAETTLTVEKGSEIVNSLVKDANVGLNIGTITVAIPEQFALYNNYPNPFNPSTTIAYDMPEDGKVTLTVFNTIGQEVAKLVNGVVQEAGSYELKWNASQLASGIYLFRIHVEGAKNHTDVKKMILMK